MRGLKAPYTKRLRLDKAGTGSEYIDDDRVWPGRILILENVAVVDKTSAVTYFRIGKMSGGERLPWMEQQTISADNVTWKNGEWRLREGENVYAEINGGAAADECWLYLDGYWYEGDEE